MKTFETNAFLMTIHDDLLIEFKVKANINLESKDVWQSRDLSVDYLPGKKIMFYLKEMMTQVFLEKLEELAPRKSTQNM